MLERLTHSVVFVCYLFCCVPVMLERLTHTNVLECYLLCCVPVMLERLAHTDVLECVPVMLERLTHTDVLECYLLCWSGLHTLVCWSVTCYVGVACTHWCVGVLPVMLEWPTHWCVGVLPVMLDWLAHTDVLECYLLCWSGLHTLMCWSVYLLCWSGLHTLYHLSPAIATRFQIDTATIYQYNIWNENAWVLMCLPATCTPCQFFPQKSPKDI